MAKFCFAFLGVIGVICVVSAISDEDKAAIKADVIPILAECGKEFSITKEDVIAAKEAHDIDALNPCFYACFLKKRNVINDDGNYAPDVAKAEHAKYIHDDELLAKLDGISESCTSVNDQAVSDGAKGCERAKLLVDCLAKNKDIIEAVFKD